MKNTKVDLNAGDEVVVNTRFITWVIGKIETLQSTNTGRVIFWVRLPDGEIAQCWGEELS